MASQSVKLFNKSKRTIHGVHPDVTDADGKPKSYAFAPEKAMAFHPDEAKKLRTLYPNEIMSVEDIQTQFDENDAPTPDKAPAKGGKTISIAQAEKEKKDAVQAALDEYRATQAAKELDGTENGEGSAPGEDDQDGEGTDDATDADDEFAKKNTIAKAAGAGKKNK